MKIITNISDIVMFRLDNTYQKIAEMLQEVSIEAKNKELDLVVLEKKKMELEWELQEIERKIVEYTLKGTT